MSLELAVHDAVHDALVADATLQTLIGTRVYDRVPANKVPTFPYVVIGTIEVRDDATTCSNASEVSVTLRAISNAVGSIEAKRIGSRLREILAPEEGDNLVIAGYDTAVSAFDAAVYRPSDDPLLTEGVVSFTFLVDPA